MDELGRDFDDFVTTSSASLLRTAYLLTGDYGHAEDVLQHALLQTHGAGARCTPTRSRMPAGRS